MDKKVFWGIDGFPLEIKKKAKKDAITNEMTLKGYIIELIKQGLHVDKTF